MASGSRDKLRRFGLMSRFGPHPFFATVGEALGVYLKTHDDVEWEDWEDRMP